MICPVPGKCQPLACWLCWTEQSRFAVKLLVVSQAICDCHAPGSKKQGRIPPPLGFFILHWMQFHDRTAGLSQLSGTVRLQERLYAAFLTLMTDYLCEAPLGHKVKSRCFFSLSLTQHGQPNHTFDTVQTEVMDLKTTTASHPGRESLILKVWILFLELPLLCSLIILSPFSLGCPVMK